MGKNRHLKFNDLAPDMELLSVDAKPTRLSSLWQGRVLILAFTRHFGCPQCKEMLDQLVKFTPALAAKGLSLGVVTQGTPEMARKFCSARAPGVLCLADPERLAYQAYGLDRATLRQSILSMRVMKANQRLEAEKGWKPEMPPAGQDAFQMSATFIIGPDGRIRMPYYYDDIADHPPVELLLGGVMGMDWSTPLDSPIKHE
ncbi:MAG: peroxiredoxin-like family protein [Chloroflexi bacterium]|nr:peroxiredoxin-like family protein [Chloroflexota bacterium]